MGRGPHEPGLCFFSLYKEHGHTLVLNSWSYALHEAITRYDYGAKNGLALENVAAIRQIIGPDALLLNTEACYLSSLTIGWQVGTLYMAGPLKPLKLMCFCFADIIGDLNFGANGWCNWNAVLLSGDKFPYYYGGPNHDNTTHFGDPILFEYNASGYITVICFRALKTKLFITFKIFLFILYIIFFCMHDFLFQVHKG